MPSIQEDYTVQLESFEGPLDLLLYLIRRAEVDIQNIPIAAITDQYLLVLRQVDSVDVELAGDFLVMAATLMELKSRTLAPVEVEGEEGESGSSDDLVDPRQDLVQQLLAYQRIRSASEELEGRRLEFQRRLRVRGRDGEQRAGLLEGRVDGVHRVGHGEQRDPNAAGASGLRGEGAEVQPDDGLVEPPLHALSGLHRCAHAASLSGRNSHVPKSI